MNLPRSMVEAGAKHMHAESQTCVYTDKGEEWARLDARSKESWIQLAEPILRAAIGCAEVVVEMGTTTHDHMTMEFAGTYRSGGVGYPPSKELGPGDTILILRADAGEVDNGAG